MRPPPNERCCPARRYAAIQMLECLPPIGTYAPIMVNPWRPVANPRISPSAYQYDLLVVSCTTQGKRALCYGWGSAFVCGVKVEPPQMANAAQSKTGTHGDLEKKRHERGNEYSIGNTHHDDTTGFVCFMPSSV